MTPESNPTQRHRAETRDHVVQFYENEHILYQSVGLFLSTGLRADEGVVVIATEAHREAFESFLADDGHNVRHLKEKKQLVVLDAEGTLSKFMVDGLPEAEKFRATVGTLIEQMFAEFPRVRAYGEMVNLLWASGNQNATITLERLWNDLGQIYPFALLCGYVLSNFNDESHQASFEEICTQHGSVIPADEYANISTSDHQRRMIARLQQRAKSLEKEISRRQKIERDLFAALQLRDEFLSIAGHELRTPLTSLILQLQVLQRTAFGGKNLEKSDAAERSRKAMEACGFQSKRLGRLIDQLLDVTRIRLGQMTLQPVEFDLAALTREIVERFNEDSTSRSKITFEGSNPVVGFWDLDRIEQVITNLISNAMKYGKGKPVTVEIGLTSTSKPAHIIVKDRGLGISSKDQARIFQRFDRGSLRKDSYGGLGLGLYIVQQIVNSHGGRINLESSPGKGSTFTVELPLTLTHLRVVRGPEVVINS